MDQTAVRRLLGEGKGALSAGDPLTARGKFMTVLGSYDPTNPQAQFGVALSDALLIVQAGSDLFALARQQGLSLPAGLLAPPSELGPRQTLGFDNAGVYTLIEAILTNMETDAEEGGRMAAGAVQDPGFSFSISSLPIHWIDGQALTNLGGTMRLVEALGLTGLMKYLDGVFLCILAHNLQMDFLRFYQSLQSLPATDGDFIDELNLFATFLDDPVYPGLLGFRANGPARMQAAGRAFAEGSYALAQALQSLPAESPATSADVVGYVDWNGNGRYDVGEPIQIPAGRFPSGATWAGVVGLPTVDLVGDLRTMFVSLGDSFSGTQRFNPGKDLQPVLDALGFRSLYGVNLELPTWMDLLLSAFFTPRPVPLRALLPAWTPQGFLFEFEWTGDESHFQTGIPPAFTVPPIPADGIWLKATFPGSRYPLPYLPLPSPSLNGVLWVDSAALQGDPPSGSIHPMSLFEVNLVMARFGTYLSSFGH